jgi:hypothetical protein
MLRVRPMTKWLSLLGLPYPGGPAIDKAAAEGNPRAFRFPEGPRFLAAISASADLKTAVLRTVENLNGADVPVDDLAASFQDAVNRVLFRKTIAAARALGFLGLCWLVVSLPIVICASALRVLLILSFTARRLLSVLIMLLWLPLQHSIVESVCLFQSAHTRANVSFARLLVLEEFVW